MRAHAPMKSARPVHDRSVEFVFWLLIPSCLKLFPNFVTNTKQAPLHLTSSRFNQHDRLSRFTM